jgi:hypothetical protein
MIYLIWYVHKFFYLYLLFFFVKKRVEIFYLFKFLSRNGVFNLISIFNFFIKKLLFLTSFFNLNW